STGVRIGVNTTAPAYPFTVNAQYYGLAHTYNGVTMGTYVDGNGGWLGTTSNHPLLFFTNNGAARLVITPGGNVGNGLNLFAPEALLDVAGTARMTGFKLPTGAGANLALVSDAAGNGTWGLVTNAMITSLDYAKLTNVPPNTGTGWSLTGNASTNPTINF